MLRQAQTTAAGGTTRPEEGRCEVTRKKCVWTRVELLDAFLRFDREHGAYPENEYEGEAAFAFLIESAGGVTTREERKRFLEAQGRSDEPETYVPLSEDEIAARVLPPPKWVDVSTPEEIAVGIRRREFK